MTFGPSTAKWRCLRKKLETSLESSAKLPEACAGVHDCVLDCKIHEEELDAKEAEDAGNKAETTEPEIHVMLGSPLGWGCLPTVETSDALPGTSPTGDAILRKIARHGFRRPTHELKRRRVELHEVGPMRICFKHLSC